MDIIEYINSFGKIIVAPSMDAVKIMRVAAGFTASVYPLQKTSSWHDSFPPSTAIPLRIRMQETACLRHQTPIPITNHASLRKTLTHFLTATTNSRNPYFVECSFSFITLASVTYEMLTSYPRRRGAVASKFPMYVVVRN
jgi:hypothetical protein